MAPPWAIHRRGSGFCRPPPPPGNAVGLGEDLPAVDFTMGDRDLKLVPIGGGLVRDHPIWIVGMTLDQG
jgi:hypothetical protein